MLLERANTLPFVVDNKIITERLPKNVLTGNGIYMITRARMIRLPRYEFLHQHSVLVLEQRIQPSATMDLCAPRHHNDSCLLTPIKRIM